MHKSILLLAIGLAMSWNLAVARGADNSLASARDAGQDSAPAQGTDKNSAPGQGADNNLARGKSYTLSPAPNYSYCTDPGDATQLTDGQYVQGYFWTQKGTVGWSGHSPVDIIIDLGKVQPISGVSFNTAAGVAGVSWPSAIWVLLSEDGTAWRVAGELVQFSLRTAKPPEGTYTVHRFRTDSLAGRGRFVKLLIAAGGSFVFCDEIEVYRGGEALLTAAPAGKLVTDPQQFYQDTRITACVQRRLRNDLAAVREELKGSKLAEPARRAVQAELDAIDPAIPATQIEPSDDFSTVFPITDLHRRIFAAQAAIWRGDGEGEIVVWQKNPWDMLSPTEPPGMVGAGIDLEMMRNEFRSAAFNLTNTTAGPLKVELALEQLPRSPTPDWVSVYEVPFTDTLSGVPVAAALVPAKKDATHYLLELLPGLTRQIWLTFHTADVAAGEYHGRAAIRDASGRQAFVPLAIRVHPVRMGDPVALHLAGWDYTDRDQCYEATPANRDVLIRHLREHFVDTPWAQSDVMPTGQYDAAGKMVQPPDPADFQKWIGRWKGARNYFVFAAVGESFAGHAMGTPAFRQAVTEWINWWVGQLGKWSIQPEQLGLLLVDEPNQREQDRVIVEYARVIRAAQPKVVIWNDPTWAEPSKATPELFELSTALCPNLPMWLDHAKAFGEFYARQREAGRRLWLYSCSGPGRLLDPYAYHRMQAWFCWKFGAEGEGFWAFGDSNGSSSWNEYGCTVGAYTPLFLDKKSVTAGKHMEAVREGVEDYQYLRMLRDRLEAARKKGAAGTAAGTAAPSAVEAAEKLLASAADEVTACMTGSAMTSWKEPKDRSLADKLRTKVLQALARLPE